MNLAAIQKVSVLGLGTMGHGIAQTFAVAGYQVQGFDESPQMRSTLHDRVRQNLRDFVAAGLMAESDIEPTLSRIRACDSEAEAVRDVQFVTEAVLEQLPLKQQLFARLEPLVSDDTILASNSSSFPISQTAAAMRRPERALVTHWFNPPHIVPTVEIVPGPQTAAEVTQTAVELHRRIGKLAIAVRQELPGFLVNRVQVAVMREVWDLLERGVASAEDIDAAIRGSMGFRLAAIGPLQVHDFGGLDIQAAVYRNLCPEIRSDCQLPRVIEQLVADGNYGFKTGQGFYHYTPQSAEATRSERDERYLALLKLFHSLQLPDKA